MRNYTRVAAFFLGASLITAACGSDTNDHGTYSSDGSPLSSSLTVAVPDDGSAEIEADQVVEVHIVDGRPEGGSNRVSVELGTTVAVRITSDTVDEVHVHGYDIVRTLSADSTIEFAFTASIPGVFEVELEESGRLVVELEIS